MNDAEKAARAPQVRVAKWLPYTRGTVTDLDHLLGAASVVIDAADDALTLYTEFSGDTSKLFENGKVDVNALVRGRDALREMEGALTEAEVRAARGQRGRARSGDDALKKKRTGLKQIRDIRAEIRPFAPVVDALPAALGADGTKRYLVAVMNPAEMRALRRGTAQRRPRGPQERQADDPPEGDDVVDHAGLARGSARRQPLPRLEAGQG